jgi:two-component system OmpR family response regulator
VAGVSRSACDDARVTGPSPGRARRVLVVDDDDSIRDLVTTALEFVGFEVTVAVDGFAGLAAAADVLPDLIVLDVMMPGIDGLEVCRRLRADGDVTPVVFLTSNDAAPDVLQGFGAGGDDYLPKPFNLQVLIARIEAVLRRSAAGPGTVGTSDRLVFAGLELDEGAHRVWRDGERISLSPTEFKLLRYFLLNPDRVVSKAQIVEHIWQYDFDGDPNIVETHLSYLRKKLGEPRVIHTVRGVGYVLRHGGA